MGRTFKPVAKSGADVEKTIQLLEYVEKLSKALREKVQTEQVSPDWLLDRAHKAALELNLAKAYLTARTHRKPKKPQFKPSPISVPDAKKEIP